MTKTIQKYIARFNDHNFKILWFEALLFSAIIGPVFHAWAGVGLLFAGLWWLLDRRRGTVYMIYVLSAAWGFLGFAMGFCFGGWGWGLALAGLAFMNGVKVHYRDLKRPLEANFERLNANEWRQNWYLGNQNLN